MTTNKHGLSRYVPKRVRVFVRRRCGFGCVICGSAIFTYEHFDPRFEDARTHDPAGMTLLCGAHQLESAKGLLSVGTIADANGDPACKREGYASCMLDLGSGKPSIMVGTNDVCGPRIVFDDETLFEIAPPENRSKRWRLSATFKDAEGATVGKIVDNELIIGADLLDVEQTKTRFKISVRGSDDVIEFELLPPQGLHLTRYKIRSSFGDVTIGEQDVPAPLEGGTQRKLALTFDRKGGGRSTFVDCRFSNPQGVHIRFEGGGITFS